MRKIFVYGTLMRGESNHSLLSDNLAEYIGTGVSTRGYTLYDLGGFPGMVSGGNNAILGEIYEVCSFTVRLLDRLEGHPQFYRRSIISLQSGEKVEAYILEDGFIKGCPIIESGDWHNK